VTRTNADPIGGLSARRPHVGGGDAVAAKLPNAYASATLWLGVNPDLDLLPREKVHEWRI
jgi:hypothetical protein